MHPACLLADVKQGASNYSTFSCVRLKNSDLRSSGMSISKCCSRLNFARGRFILYGTMPVNNGVVKAAVHVRDSKFTTLFREVGLAMMLKKISSPSVGNVTGRSIRMKRENRSDRLSVELGCFSPSAGLHRRSRLAETLGKGLALFARFVRSLSGVLQVAFRPLRRLVGAVPRII